MKNWREEPTNGQVLLGAMATSVLAAGVAIGLGRRGDAGRPGGVAAGFGVVSTPEARLRQRAEAIGRLTAESAPDVAAVASKRARAAAVRARREAERARQEADRVARGVPVVAGRAGAVVETEANRLRSQVRSVVRQGGEKGHEVARKADRATRRAKKLGEETTSTAQAAAARAAATVVGQAERALGRGVSLLGLAKEQVPAAASRGRERVVPSVRDASVQAAANALEAWQGARERAAAAAAAAESEIGRSTAKAAHVAADSRGRLRSATTATAGRAAERASAVGERAAEVRSRATSATRGTAAATVETGKDASATLFWTGAAASLIYYALLSPERRDQVVQVAREVGGQIQELVRDFRGYDDEF